MTKQVLVTGAGTGFGRGVTIELARLGWNVVAGCENWPQVRDLRAADELRDFAETVTVIKLDVADEVDRRKALAEHGPDVFFCNAALFESGSVIETPLEVYRRAFEVNVWGAVALIQGFGRKMVERRSGRIVWTSSLAGLSAVPWAAPYSASKFAVEALASAAHRELAPYGVEVCTINPGAYATGFNDTGMETQNQWRGQVEFRLPQSPDSGWLENQRDPVEVVEATVRAITDAHPVYRTFVPDSGADRIKARQALQWDLRI